MLLSKATYIAFKLQFYIWSALKYKKYLNWNRIKYNQIFFFLQFIPVLLLLTKTKTIIKNSFVN